MTGVGSCDLQPQQLELPISICVSNFKPNKEAKPILLEHGKKEDGCGNLPVLLLSIQPKLIDNCPYWRSHSIHLVPIPDN